MRILFQGDSITDGARNQKPERNWDKNHMIGHSYAYVICGKLGCEDPMGYEFVNKGISGDNVHLLEKRWDSDCIDIAPDLLSVLVGINGNGRTDEGTYVGDADEMVSSYEATYRRILKKALDSNPNLKIVIIEPFALPVGVFARDYENFMARLSRISAAAKRVAEDFGAAFVPIQEELDALSKETDPALWLWDGIHPTERAHWLIATRWLEAAEPFLKKV